MTRMAQVKLEMLAAMELEEMPHEDNWSSDWHMRAALKDMAQEILELRKIAKRATIFVDCYVIIEPTEDDYETKAFLDALKEYNNGQ